MSSLVLTSTWWIAALILHSDAGVSPAAPDLLGSKACAPCVERNDDVWLISTRHLCYQCGTDPASYDLDVRRHDPALGWVDSSFSEFVQLEPCHTVVYVHGNRIEWSESFHHGWDVYQSLATCSPAAGKMRFVIWTWPSEQIRGPLRDIREKADRAQAQSYLFGGFLSRLPPSAPLSLIGYSYGARIITGGLHLYAGGTLGGVAAPSVSGIRPSIGVALLAAATDHDSMCPHESYGRGLEVVDRLSVLYNPCDPALQRYHLVDRCSSGLALGYVGLPDACAHSFRADVRQLDVSRFVGRSHDEERYFSAWEVRQEICRVLFDAVPVVVASR